MPDPEPCIDCGEEPRLQGRRVGSKCNYRRKLPSIKRWKAANRERDRELNRRSRQSRYGPARSRAIQALGSACAVCEFSDERCLEFDHVAAGGTVEREGLDRVRFYNQIANGERDDIQLLCLNHHRLKTIAETQH